MLQSDAGAADTGPAEPAPTAPRSVIAVRGERDAANDEARPARRQRYGRRRGPLPVGEWFVSRLGPQNGEPFVCIDDPQDDDARGRPAPDTPLDQLRFVALDCETTGQTPHRLVELGAVAFTLSGHLASLETLVHNSDRINPYARRLHGISSATLAGAPPAGLVLERFRRFAIGAVLVEHSADAFDTRLIARTLGEPLDNDNIDTSRLAAKLWDLRDTIGLERLCTELGVSHRRPHHALADAEATAACFLALVERGREQFGWHTLGELLADGQPPQPRPLPSVLPLRRHGGRTRSETRAEADPAAAGGEVKRRRRRRGGRRRRRDEGPRAEGSAPRTAGSEAT